MSNNHDDETLFPLELGEHRYPSADGHGASIQDQTTALFDNDDDNRFVDNDTGVDPSQTKSMNQIQQ